MSHYVPDPSLRDWAQYHRNLFGLEGDRAAASLVAWVSHFERHGVSAHDLYEASDWLAANQPPRFLGDHLRALRQALEQLAKQRAIREHAQAQTSTSEDYSQCADCQSTGFARVPSLKAARLYGEYRESTVVCRCARGRQLAARQHDRHLPDVNDLEVLLPDWRVVMAAASQAIKAGDWPVLAAIVKRLQGLDRGQEGQGAMSSPFGR